MQYVILFLEGVVTFVSPCLLPMLPVYLSYFAGGGERTAARTLRNACGFVLGFTLVFVALGALSGVAGSLLIRYRTLLNLLTGAVVVLFGLNYLGVFGRGIFRGSTKTLKHTDGFLSAVLFGIVFSVGWTPCVGAFLGSALMMASGNGEVGKGVVMLLVYSAGLGLPFLLSAVLLARLKGAFDWIKKHYTLVNRLSGALLVAVGILMMTGLFGSFLGTLS